MATKSKKGLKINRFYTRAAADPLENVSYELRTSRITNPDGSTVFEMKNVEVPASWSQVATDILAQKYFRKKGVLDRFGGRNDSEWSAKQVVCRLAGTWRYWGEKYEYFETQEDAQNFEDELKYMLINQFAAPNSPQWFNTGLNWAYKITGDAQGHFYVDPESNEMKRATDAYTHPQPHACGRWDTKIITDEGVLNLGDIVEQNLTGLKLFDGERWVRILATKANGVRSLYKMTLANGQYIEFTDDHLVWAASNRSKENGKYSWIPLKKCLGKRVQLVSAQVPEKVFAASTKTPVAEAALAGFHIGDGYHSTYNGITHFGVCTNDPDEFSHITNLFNQIFGGYTVTEKPTISENYKIVRRDFNYTELFAERYGLGVGSEAVRIHDIIFKSAPKVRSAFLRGLFQADGCIRIRKRGKTESGDICLTTISEGLAHDVQNLLLSLGIYSRITTCRDKRKNRSVQYHIEIAYASERKKFENIIGFISQSKIKRLCELNSTIDGKIKPSISEELVTSIEYIGEEIVYDIQTESGKFLANGITVHNCFIQSVKDDLVNEGGIFDLMIREARLFKYGSGTGSNFSALRGKSETLSGGGKSSGLMSFLTTIDRAAGAIKSGGTTRRAAKMVCLDIDHPEVEDFINWKVIEEQKVAGLVAGSHICYEYLKRILECANEKGLNPEKNPDLKKLIQASDHNHVPLNYIKRILMLAEQGMTSEKFNFRTYDTDFRSEAYLTVAGQNSNNSLRVSNEFLDALKNNEEWALINRTDGKIAKKIPAKKLWDEISYAAWSCADPAIQFDTTFNEWHTCPLDGRIKATNPCVTGDTLVATSDGLRRIANLAEKDVEIFDPLGTIQKADRVFKTGFKSVYELKTRGGYSLKVTEDHLIFTDNRGFVPAKHLNSDDKIRIGQVGSFGNTRLPMRFAEILGLAVGDGCITQDSSETLFITLCKNELKLAEDCNEYLMSYKQNFSSDKRSARNTSVTDTPTTVRVGTASRTVIEKMKKYAVLNKGSEEKQFTDDIFELDETSIASILRGLFTADGTVANYGEKSQYVALDSCSKTLLQQVQLLLLNFGIKSKLYENRRAGKLTAVLPDGKGGLKQYDVKEMHSLRISRFSRQVFAEKIGFVENHEKSIALKKLNDSVATYNDTFTDQFKSLIYIGEDDVYDLTEPVHHAFFANGLLVHNCSEYAFLDDTACNLASVNLIKFYDTETGKFDVESFKHACRIWTIVLEISVLMAQFPSKEIAQRSYNFRTLGLGYANLGTLLMQMGIPYSSEEAYAICGAVTSIMCGQSYETSAEMTEALGTFANYEKNKKHMLRVIKNHRLAAYNAPKNEYENLTVTPRGIEEKYCPDYLFKASQKIWDSALTLGEKFGFRNAQVTVIAPTGTIGLVMDCDTTGIEPDFALVKFKKLVGGGYFKIVNQSVTKALKTLGYSKSQIEDIEKYICGSRTLAECPFVNEKTLSEIGFTERELLAIETQLSAIFDIRFAFNRFVLGDEFCHDILGLTDEILADPHFDLLQTLGFTNEQIEAANEYICGTMMIEGAPHLKEIHYPVFDCANRCGKRGQRFIPWMAHIKMMAAAQPFITGAISKTINMPEEATIKDIEKAYILSWEHMLKAVALYRDSSKLSQPLNTSAHDHYAALFKFDEEDTDETFTAKEMQQAIEREAARPIRRKLPNERHSITHKFSVANHEGYITIGLYEDGAPGEIFIKMSKEGSTLSGIMDAFALTISLCLQYGVPLEVLVAKFCHSRFEPSGMTGNKNIPIVKSIVDYIGRYLALKFLPKEAAKKYHNAELIDRAYAETNPVHLQKVPAEPFYHTRKHISPASSQSQTKAQLEKTQKNLVLALNNEDAPICGTCGTVMVRNGACYKCLDCGETSGCS
ncbi:vitamin B12-dependent ribonucleotide reductase [Candidatus Peregrinibacteria bacterium]|nr:vitamin B12-dependent ribonucleotide reductase [Candidatus Peregrinibacteria bacterium]